MAEQQTFHLGSMSITWSDWYRWERFKEDARSGGLKVPNHKPGVYEAKLMGSDERLTIGKASDLRMRIKQGLVKGKVPHSSGNDIRAHEDTDDVVIRWAETERPAAVEEELHMQHRKNFGRNPKYTDH